MIHKIEADDLPTAWAKAFIECYEAPYSCIMPMIVKFKVTDENTWDNGIKNLLNNNLKKSDEFSTETVRNTIFPELLWKTSNGNRGLLYAKYLKIWPRLKKTQQNRLGSYFKRLIAFGTETNSINQIEKIIDTWQHGTHRKSALQATIFNPFEDISKAPRRGFPCLQQVVFVPYGSNGTKGLSIVGFYASQDSYRKAFGNYWGLMCLGRYVADAMGLSLKEVCCIASNYTIKDTKTKLKPLYNSLKEILKNEI